MLYHKTCLILNNNTIHEVFILQNCKRYLFENNKAYLKIEFIFECVFFHCSHNPEQEVHVADMFLSDEKEITPVREDQ